MDDSVTIQTNVSVRIIRLFVIISSVITCQRWLLLTLFKAPFLPVLMPSICLRLLALMNAPGRLERRHGGLKEVILNPKQMCLILGICIMLLCVLCDLARCFLTMHWFLSALVLVSSWHIPDRDMLQIGPSKLFNCINCPWARPESCVEENKFSLCYHNSSWAGNKGHKLLNAPLNWK